MNTETKYDSLEDTEKHIARVYALLYDAATRLVARAERHDDSKLTDPEKSAFDYATPRLAGSTYGSEEYKAFLAELKPALDHHYENNSHHPEHFRWKCAVCDSHFSRGAYEQAPQGPNDSGHRYCPKCCPVSIIYECQLFEDPSGGVNGMSLLDVLEMLVDWKAAGERHNDGSIERSLEVNRERFKISPQLQSILENTAREFGWL